MATASQPAATNDEKAAAPEETSGTSSFFALKHGDTFLVADRYGDVCGQGDGLFCNDTRMLSRWRILCQLF